MALCWGVKGLCETKKGWKPLAHSIRSASVWFLHFFFQLFSQKTFPFICCLHHDINLKNVIWKYYSCSFSARHQGATLMTPSQRLGKDLLSAALRCWCSVKEEHLSNKKKEDFCVSFIQIFLLQFELKTQKLDSCQLCTYFSVLLSPVWFLPSSLCPSPSESLWTKPGVRILAQGQDRSLNSSGSTDNTVSSELDTPAEKQNYQCSQSGGQSELLFSHSVSGSWLWGLGWIIYVKLLFCLNLDTVKSRVLYYSAVRTQ